MRWIKKHKLPSSLVGSRLLIQNKREFTIEQRILAEKPYDVDGGDPWNLNINHQRCYHWPECPYRSYDLVSASEDGKEMYHAAKEHMSFFCKDVEGLFTGKTPSSAKKALVCVGKTN